MTPTSETGTPAAGMASRFRPGPPRQSSLRAAGLRTAMIVWGLLSIASGLVSTLFPGAIGALSDARTNTFLLGSWGWLTTLLGLGILFASTDPIRHILWLRVALLSFLIGSVYNLVHVAAGTVTLGAVTVDLAAYSVFGAVFLALYPRSPRMVNLGVATRRGEMHTDADAGGLFLREVGTGTFIPFEPRTEGMPAGAPYRPHPLIARPKAGGIGRDYSSASGSEGASQQGPEAPRRLPAKQPQPPTFRPATFAPPLRRFTWRQAPSPDAPSRESGG